LLPPMLWRVRLLAPHHWRLLEFLLLDLSVLRQTLFQRLVAMTTTEHRNKGSSAS
jgi:hypothetical protein